MSTRFLKFFRISTRSHQAGGPGGLAGRRTLSAAVKVHVAGRPGRPGGEAWRGGLEGRVETVKPIRRGWAVTAKGDGLCPYFAEIISMSLIASGIPALACLRTAAFILRLCFTKGSQCGSPLFLIIIAWFSAFAGSASLVAQ